MVQTKKRTTKQQNKRCYKKLLSPKSGTATSSPKLSGSSPLLRLYLFGVVLAVKNYAIKSRKF